MKKRRYRLAIRMALIMLPLLIVAGGWIYFKLYGFKKALEDLVDSQTHGAYVLIIDKSSVNFSALSFSFEKLSIQRNAGTPPRGIHAVNIPSMHVSFGSLPSMLALEKFHIKTLTMDEPEIVIDVPARRETSTRVDLTQQIVKLYPAVESLLSRFDIESLAIRRATIELNRPHDALVRLRLVDLLVKDWDINALTEDSQLKLNISGQGLDFGKAGLSFSEIEYNFQQRHLYFADFSFTSVDTVSDSRIEVTGKSLRLQHLDYRDLYENQRYVLRRAEVDQPHVTARFKLAHFKKNKNEEGDMFTRIVKQAIGECHIDSTVIKNAQVHLVIQREKDSVKIDLPRVDFRLHTFKVRRDSTAFSIGELGINLNRTAISLRNNLLLSFHEILFDRHRNLTIINAALVDSVLHEKIVTVGKLRLEYFDLLRLVIDKEISARRVDIEDADIRLNPARVNENRSVNHGLGDIAIQNVTLKNTAIHYVDAGKQVDLKGLSLGMTHVRYDTLNKSRYVLQNVEARTVLIRDERADIESHMKDVTFDGRSLRAVEIDLRRDSLHVAARSVFAEILSDYAAGDYDHWKSIQCVSLQIDGPLPAVPDKPDHRITVEEVKADHLTADLRNAEGHISFSGENVHAGGVTNGGQVPWKTLQGKLSNLRMTTSRLNATVSAVMLNYPATIRASDMQVTQNDLEIKMKTLAMRSFKTATPWQIGSIVAGGVAVSREQEAVLQSDSVLVSHIVLGDSPVIAEAEVFHPRITLSRSKPLVGDRMSWPVPRRLTLHPGQLQLKTGKPLVFGVVELDTESGLLRCSYLLTTLGKRPVEMKGLQLEGDQLLIDSIRIRESLRREATPFEDDRIDAKLYGIQVDGISVDAGSQSATWKDLDIGLERFTLNIRRDRRLADPPMIAKPLTLEGFLHLPENVRLNKVRLKDGMLTYSEIAETGEEAVVSLDNIAAILEFNSVTSRLTLNAKTRLYGSGSVDLKYQTLDDHSFRLNVKVRDLDLTRLNQVLVPLQSVRVKSGVLLAYDLDAIAGEDKATGDAAITYRDLHLELLKRNDPDRRGLRMELINFLADGIILRNRREAAVADVSRQRIRHKSVFNYWVKTAFTGALATVKNGKRARK